MKTLNVQCCNERKADEFCIKGKKYELDVAMKYYELESTQALGNHLVIK